MFFLLFPPFATFFALSEITINFSELHSTPTASGSCPLFSSLQYPIVVLTDVADSIAEYQLPQSSVPTQVPVVALPVLA